jgi:acyl phosphate:glycerol-3-phosphate acyltransferase
MDVLLYALVAYLIGAIPFALWIGFAALKVDIRDYGDGNPGTFNVIRAGGIGWGGLALLLDISKGAAPVGLAAVVFEIDGWPLVLISLAPVLGHAFSPFLGFQGGKAIAATGGVLIGLSLIELPLVGLPALTIFYLTLTSSGWAVILTNLVLLVYILLRTSPVEWFVTLSLILVLMTYKHRDELTALPRLRRRSSHADGHPTPDNGGSGHH